MQGNIGEAASNCFFQPNNAIVAPSSSTEEFRYYVLTAIHPAYDPCLLPLGNESDGGANNYKVNTQAQNLKSCQSPDPRPPVTEEDLHIARQNTTSAWSEWQADLGNVEKRAAHFIAAQYQDYCLRTLAIEAYEADDLDQVETLLLDENTKEAQRQVVGLRTRRKDFAGAQALLDAIPVQTQDDQWFRDIMAINFLIEQSPAAYELSAQQEQGLTAIANAEYSIMRGYACALLSLCKGYTCTEPLPEGFEGDGGKERSRIASLKNVRVHPNPTADIVALECAACPGAMLTLEIFDIAGQPARVVRYANTGTYQLDTSGLSDGIYLLRLRSDSETLYVGKIAITH